MSATAPSFTPTPTQLRRATIGGAVGSVVEWFDVAVYAYLSAEIGKVFFPQSSETAQLLSSFAVFGAAFLVRPLGGIFFGHMGDRVGRQRTLAAVLLLVSGATALIGLVPGYATIGWLAPALLLVLRLAQGFSAGGEMGGASAFVAEYAPDHRRGFLVSLVELGAIAGFLLGSVVVLVLRFSLSPEALTSWGWRVPFLLALPMGLVGFWVRTKLEETPEFAQLQAEDKVSRNPLLETITQHWRSILRVFAFSLFQNAALYVILTYVGSHLTSQLHYSRNTGALSSVISMTVICALIPVSGALSDRVGRRPLLAASCLLTLVFAWPLFLLMKAGPAQAILAHALLGVILALFLGATLAAMNEMFVTRVRLGGFSIGYNLAVSAFGGTAPFIVLGLIGATGNTEIGAFYIMAAALVTLGAVIGSRETAPAKVGGQSS